MGAFGTRQQRQDRQREIDESQAQKEAEAQKQADIQMALQNLFQGRHARQGQEPTQEDVAAETGRLSTLAALNPTLAKTVSELLKSGDEQQMEAVGREVENGVRLAKQLKDAPDFVSRKKVLSEIGRQYSVEDKPLDRIVHLSNMTEGQLDTEIDRMMLAGQEVKDLLAPALPAKTREVKRGNEIVTEEWNSASGTWRRIANSPRFKENEGDDRTSFIVDNDRNILLQKLEGTTPDDLIKRTVKSTDTGFPNPDYDPYLTAQIRNALKKKKGDDPEFDRFQQLFAGKKSDVAPKAAQEEGGSEETRTLGGKTYVKINGKWFEQ
jgi:hypothetical protein